MVLPHSHLFKHVSRSHHPRALSADDLTSYFMEKTSTEKRASAHSPPHLHSWQHLHPHSLPSYLLLGWDATRLREPHDPLHYILIPSCLLKETALVPTASTFLPLLNLAYQHTPKKKKSGLFPLQSPLTSASFLCLLFTAKVFLKLSLYSLSPVFLFCLLVLTPMRYLSPPVHWDHFQDHQWPGAPLVGRTLVRYFFRVLVI